jgi:CRP-like cAMP-binding protein
MQGYELNFKANEVICHEGDPLNHLYFIRTGKVLVCRLVGSEVKALARIGAGEFLGELAFFDGRLRSSNIIALEPCTLIQIPRNEVWDDLPDWFKVIGQNLTKRIRTLDEIISSTSKIRLSSKEENKPLSIEQQTLFYKILTHQNG